METHHITPARGLSETGLKWIALVTMVLDHIHYFFSFTGCVPEWFSMVGRLGAPLFLFCLVEGFTHTHSRKRYFARVYVLSTAMSTLLLLMAFGGLLVRPDGFYPTNGMMTTFVILMVIFQGIDWLGQRRMVRGLAAFLLPWPGPFWPPGCWRRSPPWPPRWASPATPSSPSGASPGTAVGRCWPWGWCSTCSAGTGGRRYWPSPCSTSSTGWCIWASWPPRCPTLRGRNSSPGTTRSTASWPRPSCCAIMGSGRGPQAAVLRLLSRPYLHPLRPVVGLYLLLN
ncbi:conjugal transfer protein TraX [Flavonifractor plautii]|nr:conjugal transfer protein TraX [Flavonifractor plautii]